MSQIILASSNTGKIKEFQELLKNTTITIIPQSEFDVSDADETGTTFIENAIIKARHACEQTNLPAIADDSGIEIDALQGAPGVYSSRYAENSKARIARALKELTGVPDEKRSARFHSVIAYMQHAKDPSPVICHGIWEGRILQSPKGSGGFGYDPIFYVPTHDCSAAELSLEEKNALSHRGQSMRMLLEYLQGKN